MVLRDKELVLLFADKGNRQREKDRFSYVAQRTGTLHKRQGLSAFCSHWDVPVCVRPSHLSAQWGSVRLWELSGLHLRGLRPPRLCACHPASPWACHLQGCPQPGAAWWQDKGQMLPSPASTTK